MDTTTNGGNVHGFSLTFYDSPDPVRRTRVLVLALSRPDAQRGMLHSAERETPADVWPPLHLEGRGFSVTSARRIARQRGLVEVS